MCDKIDGLCKNTTGCEPGYLYEDYCNKSTSIVFIHLIAMVSVKPFIHQHGDVGISNA